MVLDLEAERVADTLQQRLAMIVESDRWDSHRDDLKKGTPPPARNLSPAETAALECEALGRWSSRLADEQPQSAVAAVQKYISERPACYATHLRLSDLLARAAHDTPDPNARAAALERAISELEQVIDLAPTALDRSGAFSRVVELSGPKELNHPERVERAARSLVKRQPDDPVGHYTLAAVPFPEQAGRAIQKKRCGRPERRSNRRCRLAETWPANSSGSCGARSTCPRPPPGASSTRRAALLTEQRSSPAATLTRQ